ncbi:hypothetical protein DIPPA_06513 [Diplonema papillatum]|nr:hypothetical protein DIPPA_06513 [Diplonema papillatum]
MQCGVNPDLAAFNSCSPCNDTTDHSVETQKREEQIQRGRIEKRYKSTPVMLSVMSRAQRYAEQACCFDSTLSDEAAFLM